VPWSPGADARPGRDAALGSNLRLGVARATGNSPHNEESSQVRRPFRVLLLALATTGCATGEGAGGVEGRQIRLSAAQVESLPRLEAAAERVLCTADGYGSCPLLAPVANWIRADEFALWEAGRRVVVFSRRDTAGRTLGPATGARANYVALAVGPEPDGYGVIDGMTGSLLRYDASGFKKSEVALRALGPLAARGYSGSTPVLQGFQRGRGASDPNTFQLRLLDSPGDTVGTMVFNVPVPWLTVTPDGNTGPVPLFAFLPPYAVDRDRSVVWSRGVEFEVTRQSPGGNPVWSLQVDRPAPAVTAADIEVTRRELEANGGSLTRANIDSLVANAASTHAAIAGILIGPQGDVLVGGSAAPSRDSIEYLVLQRDGQPVARTALPSSWKPLLFGGDSILVHRKTETELREVVWIRFGRAAR
jgi:hypothetical protein